MVTFSDIECIILLFAAVETIKSNLPREENCSEFVQAYEESKEEAKAAEQYRPLSFRKPANAGDVAAFLLVV